MAPPDYDAEGAKAALKAMGGKILFEKVLTSSDANGTGRLVIPKGQAEAHLPFLEEQQGTTLQAADPEGGKHSFRFRFWVNNQSSRMYLLEDTMGVQQKYGLSAGDVLVFAKLEDGSYGVCGRKGTKDDVSRKPAVRRNSSGALAGEGGSPSEGRASGKRSRSRGGADSSKSKRVKQKQAEQAVQSLFSYWSASSLPMRKDGVFRAVPNSALQEGDKVVAQFGAWSAIVSVGGELFQAFFDTHEAANAAFEAALQSMGKGSDVGPGPASQAQRAPSAEPSAGKAAAAGAGAGAAGAAGKAAAGKASPGGNSDAADGAAEAGAHQQQQEQPDVKQEQPPQQAT